METPQGQTRLVDAVEGGAKALIYERLLSKNAANVNLSYKSIVMLFECGMAL
jgi:hypothetical protein